MPERGAVWDTIPVELWKVTKTAAQAANCLESNLSSTLAGQPVGVGFSSDNSRYDKQVVVTRHERPADQQTGNPPSVQKLERITPGTVRGSVKRKGELVEREFEVVIENQRVANASDCGDYFNEDLGDSIPGGVMAENGTLGTPASDDSDGSNVMVHCGHIAKDNQKLAQPNARVSLVELYAADQWAHNVDNRKDYGYYYPAGGVSPQYELGAMGGGTKTPDIMGIVTWERLMNKEGDPDYYLKHQGQTTGNSSGNVTKLEDGRWVITDCEGWAGDSGSPLFEEVSNPNLDINEVYIASIHSQYVPDGSCDYNYTSGNSMECIENQLGVSV